MPPVIPSVHDWEVSREWSWEDHGKTKARRDGYLHFRAICNSKGVFWLNSQYAIFLAHMEAGGRTEWL